MYNLNSTEIKEKYLTCLIQKKNKLHWKYLDKSESEMNIIAYYTHIYYWEQLQSIDMYIDSFLNNSHSAQPAAMVVHLLHISRRWKQHFSFEAVV